MAVDTQQIIAEAEKLGLLIAQHPAVIKYKQAQKSVSDDAEAARLLSDFDRQLDALQRQESSGMQVTDAQRMQLEALQSRIVSHLKVKNLNLAQVEFMDLLRRVAQTYQRHLVDSPAPLPAAGSPAAMAAR